MLQQALITGFGPIGALGPSAAVNGREMTWSEVREGACGNEETIIKNIVLQSLSWSFGLALLFPTAGAQEREDETRDGKLAFNTSCRTCHSLDDGDNRLGPNLHGIVGREAGSENYGYSPAMTASGVVWDAESLDRFIEAPDAVVPGNNMKPYGGISDPEIRASIVDYLSAASKGNSEGKGDKSEEP